MFLLTSTEPKTLPGGRMLYMIRQADNPGVELASLFHHEVVIDDMSWCVVDVSFREGLGDSGQPSEVGLVVEPA